MRRSRRAFGVLAAAALAGAGGSCARTSRVEVTTLEERLAAPARGATLVRFAVTNRGRDSVYLLYPCNGPHASMEVDRQTWWGRWENVQGGACLTFVDPAWWAAGPLPSAALAPGARYVDVREVYGTGRFRLRLAVRGGTRAEPDYWAAVSNGFVIR
jgi:hypothetical protein